MVGFNIRRVPPIFPGRLGAQLVPVISADQRDALYAQIMDDLKVNGDLSQLSESGDPSAVRAQAREVADDLTLILEALSWGETSTGIVELALPPDQLHRAFTRYRERSYRQKEAELRANAFSAESSTRTDLIIEACDEVLDALARSGPRR